MPKKVYEINPFHGGINTKDDPRDILDHQLVDVLGASVDSKGVLKVIGNAEDLGIDTTYTSDTNASGYGFFRFSADTDASGNSGTDAYNTDYLIFWNEDDEKLYWYDGSSWSEALDLVSAWSAAGTDGKRKPVFSYANGALRICDANFNNTTNENYWLGVLDKTIFKGSNAERVDTGWYSTAASIAKPTAALVRTGADAFIDNDAETNAEDITWVITSAREDTDRVWAGIDQDGDWDQWDDSGQIRDWADVVGSSGAYNTGYAIGLGFQTVDWDGSNDSAQTHTMTLDKDDTTGSAALRWNGFTIDPAKSLYLSIQLPRQDQFDAWGAGWAKNSSTTV